MLTAKIESWCPPYQQHKDALLTHEAMRSALLTSEFYEALPPACDMLENIRRLGKSFLSDGTATGAVIDVQVLKAAASAVKLGLECMCVTFGLFLVIYVLPKLQSALERATKVKDFVAKCKDKRIDLGTDMVARLAELASPDFQVQGAV